MKRLGAVEMFVIIITNIIIIIIIIIINIIIFFFKIIIISHVVYVFRDKRLVESHWFTDLMTRDSLNHMSS